MSPLNSQDLVLQSLSTILHALEKHITLYLCIEKYTEDITQYVKN